MRNLITQTILSKTFGASLMTLAALGLASACDTGEETTERSSQYAPATPSKSQAEQANEAFEIPAEVLEAVNAEVPAAPASQPAAFAGDWQAQLGAEVSRIQGEAPDWFDALMSAEAKPSRAGMLRFVAPEFQDPNAAVVLLHRYVNGDDAAPVKAALVDALQRTKGDYALPVSELFADAEPVVRVAMVNSMRRAEGEHAFATLAQGLADADVGVRIAAADTLAMHKSGATLGDELIAALGDSELRVQAAAAKAIGYLEVGSASDLAPLLGSEDADVRLRALQAMERVEPGAAVGMTQFATLLEDADPTVARAAKRIAQ